MMKSCVLVRREVKSERIMNEENDWDHNVEVDEVGPVVCVSREDVVQALNEMKTRQTPGPSVVSFDLIASGCEVGFHVMTELCKRILDGFGMPAEEFFLSIVFSFLKEKGDIRNCS